MPQIDALRGRLLENGARLSVVKNTLTRRAAEAAGADALLALLEGPTAIAFIEADGDMVAVAKALADSARETKVLEIRGGVMQGREIPAASVEELAKLPPIDVLRGQVLGAIIAPLSAIAALVNAPLQNLYGLLEARIEQLGSQPEGDHANPPEADSPEETAAGESQEPQLADQPEADPPADEAVSDTGEPAAESASDTEVPDATAPADEPVSDTSEPASDTTETTEDQEA